MSIPPPAARFPASRQASRQLLDGLAVTAGGALLAAVLAGPFLARSADPGEDLTHYTVRLALIGYSLAVALMLRLRPGEWPAEAGRGRLARWLWTLGVVGFLLHVGIAFHVHHHWSHAEAMSHVEAGSGFGPGIFVSYLFTLVWALDLLWWWLAPAGYAGRPAWVGRLTHGFLAFLVFNGTVVYKQGVVRWAGAVAFALFAGLLLARRRRARGRTPVPRVAGSGP